MNTVFILLKEDHGPLIFISAHATMDSAIKKAYVITNEYFEQTKLREPTLRLFTENIGPNVSSPDYYDISFIARYGPQPKKGRLAGIDEDAPEEGDINFEFYFTIKREVILS